jgi:hypothetical protein
LPTGGAECSVTKESWARKFVATLPARGAVVGSGSFMWDTRGQILVSAYRPPQYTLNMVAARHYCEFNVCAPDYTRPPTTGAE